MIQPTELPLVALSFFIAAKFMSYKAYSLVRYKLAMPKLCFGYVYRIGLIYPHRERETIVSIVGTGVLDGPKINDTHESKTHLTKQTNPDRLPPGGSWRRQATEGARGISDKHFYRIKAIAVSYAGSFHHGKPRSPSLPEGGLRTNQTVSAQKAFPWTGKCVQRQASLS